MSLFHSYFLSAGAVAPTPPAGDSFYEYLLANYTLRFLYKMDESSGTDMFDESGNSHDGSYYNTPTLGETGPFASGETAVTLNGTDEYGSVSHDADFNLGTSDFSLGFWLKDASWPTGGAQVGVIAHDGNGEAGTWEVHEYGTPLFMTLRLNGALNVDLSATGHDDGSWRFYGVSCDRSGNAQWYVDGSASGSPVGISSLSATALDATKTFYIGRFEAAGYYFGGTLAGAFLTTDLLTAQNWSDLFDTASDEGGGGGPEPDTQAETYDAAVLALSPVAYWTLDDISTTMTDSSGNGLNGTYVNSPPQVAGPMTGAYGRSFAAASTQYATVADNDLLDPGLGDWSIAFWMWRSAAWPTGQEHIVAKDGNWTTYADWMIRAAWTEDELGTWVGSNGTIYSGHANKNDSAWHLVVLTLDRDGNAQFYLDGVVDGSATDISAQSAQTMTNTYTLYIARNNAGDAFTGYLSRVALFASALTSGQVAALWTAAGN